MKSGVWTFHEPCFAYEARFDDAEWPWTGHRRFVYDLVRNTGPETIVELGTHRGTSFFAFCQAIQDGRLGTRIHAVDTWRGDAQAGFYGDEVFAEVRDIQRALYPEVAAVFVRKTFDAALEDFPDGSIDILHIDGLHTYAAVRHDFETWLPKVRADGIVLLHDIAVTRGDFGVHRFWAELRGSRAVLEFRQSYGLGVLLQGAAGALADRREELELRYAWQAEDLRNSKLAKMRATIQRQERELARLRATPCGFGLKCWDRGLGFLRNAWRRLRPPGA